MLMYIIMKTSHEFLFPSNDTSLHKTTVKAPCTHSLIPINRHLDKTLFDFSPVIPMSSMTALTLKEITLILKQLSARNHHKRPLPLQNTMVPCFSCYKHLIMQLSLVIMQQDPTSQNKHFLITFISVKNNR